MYLITNRGLEVLEKEGLKEILDKSFKNLDHYMLRGFPYDEDIEEYAKEHKIPDLMEKIKADEKTFIDKMYSFIIHSGIIYDLLRDNLPKNLGKELEDAVSAYYLYWDRFLDKVGDRGSYLWRDENFLNFIHGDVHGDMKIKQYNIGMESQLDLFGYKPLVKKSSLELIDGFYSEWIRTLSDFITFCCQIGEPVPFKDNWKDVFYNGEFEENNPGGVASFLIEKLKSAKQDEEFSFVEVLPFINEPKKHIDIKKKFHPIRPISSNSGYLSYPFIDNDSLVYLHKAKTGIEFIGNMWGNPSVRFSYDQMHNAIKGIVNCIKNYGSRCQPHDPGLVFRYFPYERFEKLI